MSQNTDLSTVRAAIEDAMNYAWPGHQDQTAWLTSAVLVTLSDPAVMDELAHWLVEQKDGPFRRWNAPDEWRSSVLQIQHAYTLRQRTRNEGI